MNPVLWRCLGRCLGATLGLVWSGLGAEPVDAAAEQILSAVVPGVASIEGKQTLLLLRHPISSLRAYVFRDGAPLPIAFQVDERDRRDRWVLDQGKKPNVDTSAGEFDENDVLVILNRDLGARGTLAQLPAGATAWQEVRVGSVVAPLGFAYIGSFAQPPPLACSDCAGARYEEASDRVYAERYALAFNAPLPTHLAFVKSRGELGENRIAGVHAAAEVRFLGGLWTLKKTDADIHAELLSYRNGPVRVMRRARYWIPLPFGFRTSGRVDLLFYRDFVESSVLLKIGIPPSLILARGELQAYIDFLRQDGARVFLEETAPSALIEGQPTQTGKPASGRLAQWAALLLPDGRAILLLARLEGALQRLEQRLFFDERESTDDTPGRRPRFGFEFARVDRLESGTHRLSVVAHILESTRTEDIRKAAQIFLHPPEVTAAALPQ